VAIIPAPGQTAALKRAVERHAMTIAFSFCERAIDVPEQRCQPARGAHDRGTGSRAALDSIVDPRRLRIVRVARVPLPGVLHKFRHPTPSLEMGNRGDDPIAPGPGTREAHDVPELAMNFNGRLHASQCAT
jgi:hypothetical protein